MDCFYYSIIIILLLDVWSTVSSGNRRSLVYTPSPQDQFNQSPPLPPINSSVINLTTGRPTPTPQVPLVPPMQQTGAPPPPPPPPVPPIANGF